MKKMLTVLFGVLLFTGIQAADWAAEKFILHNGAEVENGVLKLNKPKAYATIPGTEKMAIRAPGLTLACSVKAAYDLRKGESEKMMDSYFSVPQALFTICRWGGLISTRVLDAKTGKYVIERAYKIPQAGVWTHLAFVFEPVKDKAGAWRQCFYVNGKKIYDKTLEKFFPRAGKGPVELGKGWGGPWMLTGEMTDIHIVQAPLTEAEVKALAAKSRALKK